ncbi:MAG: hypothetical protein GWM90_20885 [Gemmatimonadetes bacterium]|nr:hypothetical protein [Gemmatimonadota bacterium]NIQ56955.1 hypothetical protein [Gemmatimonadota bacterium]NIU77126.1 hypothetical protein [Gammaproteobacteria bacterium]NIX46447.1 hypothetical protein [Gemmatimonadota bacterium]NIY10761.1 hypothetical protein [Gemmatimonadota bacterium]
MSRSRSVVTRGAVAGVLAASAIVVFFLVVDLARGEVLRTPSFLAAVLLGLEEGAIGPVGVGAYTILHYVVFAGIGIGMAWVLDRLLAPATLLLGVVVGFLLFDAVFYLGLALTGVDIVDVIGWPSFLAGNLIGGLVLAASLERTGGAPRRSWREVVAEHRVVREGVIAGLLGGLAVAAWFFVVDLGIGRLLYTPGALGSALIMGVDSPSGVEVTPLTVMGYTAIHFGGFIAMGLVFAALVARAEENPPLLMGLTLLFVTFETLLLGLVAILAAWLLDVLPWWSIALSNLVAAAVMAIYLWRAHPGLGGIRWGDVEDGGGPGPEPDRG